MRRLMALVFVGAMLVGCRDTDVEGELESINAEFVADVNAQRSAPLATDSGLQAYAQNHLNAMVAEAHLYHSDVSTLLGQWSIAGENIGYGPNEDSILTAFMNSASHAENITCTCFSHLGVASGIGQGGNVWAVLVFGG